MHHQGIMMRALRHWENWITCCQEISIATHTYPVGRAPAITQSLSLSGGCQWILWRIVISTDWKGINYNLTLIIVGLYDEAVHIPIDALGFGVFYCNNVTFGAKSSQSRSHVTTIIQDFTLVSLTFIDPQVLLKPRHWVGGMVPLQLRHWAGGTSTYKSEGYSVGRVLGMIRDDEGE